MNQADTLLALLGDHDPALRRIARVYAGPEGEEDDLYQEIVTQAWKSLPRFQGDSAAGTWLYRVALNTALTWRRRANRHASRHVAEPQDGAAPIQTEGLRSQAAILADFLGTLTGPDHSVIVLYMEGLPYQEIADVTGLSVSAVGVRLHRMKRAFTERYVEG